MLSALANGVKGGKWFSLMDKVYAPKTLAVAWAKVRANKGVAGVDGQSISRFAAKADDYLAELSTALRNGTYRPQAVKRVEIPKGDGRTRPLGIPTVKDRIVQQAVRLVIEPIFETSFCDGSVACPGEVGLPTKAGGFRPGRGCHDALREVDRLIKEGFTHVVDADLASYFDTIPHDRLMARVEERVSDGRVLDLIRSWLKADILKGLERWTPTQGSPQGAVISPLLANIYLDPLDRLLAERGYRMVRYADDFVILCRSREEADAALALVGYWVADNGLTLHPTKTHVGDCRLPGQGFEFVMRNACLRHDGYRFEGGRRYVRKKSMDKLKDKIREKTKRTCGQSLAVVIVDLNRTSCGTHACGMTRLVRLLQAGSPHHLRRCRWVRPTTTACDPDQAGQARAHRDRARGQSTLVKCLLRECRAVRTPTRPASSETVSMKKPPTGEPCAGKPPARFGGRGG